MRSFYYIHTDYVGSWLVITDSLRSLKNRYSYDAWGRPRDPNTWQLKTISQTSPLTSLYAMQPRFDRGYTGHEMMCSMGLINMNGRLYDPYVQRFLSPDPVVQDPFNSQSYNRYAYCLNNPLRYIDPSGYTWGIFKPFVKFGNWIAKAYNDYGNWMIKHHDELTSAAVAIAVGVAVSFIPGLGPVGIAFVGGMLGGASGSAVGAALSGGDIFQGAMLGGIFGAMTGMATLGITSVLGNIPWTRGGWSPYLGSQPAYMNNYTLANRLNDAFGGSGALGSGMFGSISGSGLTTYHVDRYNRFVRQETYDKLMKRDRNLYTKVFSHEIYPNKNCNQSEMIYKELNLGDAHNITAKYWGQPAMTSQVSMFVDNSEVASFNEGDLIDNKKLFNYGSGNKLSYFSMYKIDPSFCVKDTYIAILRFTLTIQK